MDNMKMMLIIGVVFIVFMAILGIVAFIAIKKSPNILANSSTSGDAQTAQDFVPIVDIRDGVLNLGNHEYRIILESDSINYDLQTDVERMRIDGSFQRFLDSLTFPITFHIQTRTIDIKKSLDSLEEDMIQTVNEFEGLRAYAIEYLQEMSRVTETIGNTKQKKKYIIVSCSDSSELTYSTEEEKYEESLRILALRAQIVADGLSALGIKARVLTSVDIAELIYSTYHRDNYSDIDQILSGDYMSLIVDGPNALQDLMGERNLAWMISELENRLKLRLESKDLGVTDLEKRKTKAVLEKIIQLKRAVEK